MVFLLPHNNNKKKTSLPGVVIQDLKMHISYTMKEKIKHTVSIVWHEPSADTSWRLNTMQTVISSRMWSQVQTCWKQAAATWLIKAKAGIVQINYSLKTLLHHVYTNNLSFFTERAFTFAPVRDARKTKHLKHAIKACINKCMYKRKCGEKAQALKNVFSDTCWRIFSCKTRKETAGETKKNLQDKQILCYSLRLIWEGRMCLQYTLYQRPCRITPPGEALKLTVVPPKWDGFTPQPRAEATKH